MRKDGVFGRRNRKSSALLDTCPGALDDRRREAVDALEKDKLVQSALGPHILQYFVAAKRAEWHDYIAQVHEWEIKRYLSVY